MKNTNIDLDSTVSRWTGNRFTMRSGYYAGRGPQRGDLNSNILEMIYQGLKKDVSPEVAANFVRFVNKLGDLSASSFIVAFEKFWGRGCTAVEVRQEKGDRMQLSGRGAQLEGEAFGAIASALFGPKLDEHDIIRMSQGIKREFVIAHIPEIPSEELGETPLVSEDEFGFGR